MKYLMSLWLLFTGMLVQAQTATEVIAKADKVMRGSSST